MHRIQTPPLGKLQKLTIGHNNKGSAPAWHLDMVEVTDETTGLVSFFRAGRWLGKDVQDGVSEISLIASTDDPRKTMADYKVGIY